MVIENAKANSGHFVVCQVRQTVMRLQLAIYLIIIRTLFCAMQK